LIKSQIKQKHYEELFFLACLITGLIISSEAQTQGVAINGDNSIPDPSAMLE
jgi:hypothetical protein